MSVPDQLAEFSRRAAALGKSPEEVARLTGIAEQYLPYAHRQFAEAAGERGILTRPDGINAEDMSPGLYGQRTWQDVAEETASGGSAQATKNRTIKGGGAVSDKLNEGAATLERDLGVVSVKRAG